MPESILIDCPECDGDGVIDAFGTEHPCRDCGGQGEVYRTVTA